MLRARRGDCLVAVLARVHLIPQQAGLLRVTNAVCTQSLFFRHFFFLLCFLAGVPKRVKKRF